MFQGQNMMYSMYQGGQSSNIGRDHNPYSVYATGNNNMFNPNMPAAPGTPLMYLYGNGASAGGSPSMNGAYGMPIDPSIATGYEYNGINSVNGSRGQGGQSGFNRRGGNGGGHHRGGGMGGFDQTASSDYEVHDNQLKAPVVVTPATVVPTSSSVRLFSRPPRAITYGSRSVVRICDAFQEGRCQAGDKCHDIHVKPEFLAETRMQMSSWLMDREEEFRRTAETDPGKTFRIFVADLKEVVEVPMGSLVFTKGLYVDPTTRAKRARGAGNHAHAHAVMQVPTSCGLYSSDPLQCKWGRWCNQVHIDHRWMQFKKEEFDQWFNELQSRYFSLAPDDNFTVHDPQLKASISLPKFSIAGFSRGLFQGSMKKLASVCLLYQRGKCTAGSCCNQIHVVPQYLALSRELVTLEQSPDSPVEERQRVAREMEMLRGPCIEQQLREQREAEIVARTSIADGPTVQRLPVALDGVEETPSDPLTASPVAEDEMGSNGALFEHVQVDEDVEAPSHPVSANTSLTRGLNTSAPDISLSDGRHMNSDGRYSFNPYGSVTSLPEASSSFGRTPAGRGGANTASSNAYNGNINGDGGGGTNNVTYSTGSVQLHSTGMKGGRRLVAVVSPESGAQNSGTENLRSDEMGNSSTADGCFAPYMMERHAHGAGVMRGGVTPGYRGAVQHRPYGASAQEQSSSMHPLDFDASLHFSSSPLLNFEASNTSLHRNGSIREEEAMANLNLRMAASSTTQHPGNSTNAHPHAMSPLQPGLAPFAAKTRFSSTGAVSTRPFGQRATASIADVSARSNTSASMGESAPCETAARPPTGGEAGTGAR